jgi:hypothetical protein
LWTDLEVAGHRQFPGAAQVFLAAGQGCRDSFDFAFTYKIGMQALTTVSKTLTLLSQIAADLTCILLYQLETKQTRIYMD